MLLAYVKRGANATFFYALSSVISRAISFLFLPFFLSKLTLEEFGIWDFYQTFFATGTLIISSCASTGLFRFYLLYKDDEKRQQQCIGNSLLFILLSTSLFPFIMALFLFFFNSSYLANNYLYLTILNVSFFALFSIFLSFLRVKEKLVWYTIAFSGQSILALAGTVLGVWFDKGIYSFFYANLLSYIIWIPFFINLFLQNRSYCWLIFKDQIQYSVPLLFYSVIYTTFFTIDKYFLKTFLGFEMLGVYGLLWRFGTIFQMLTIAMIDAWITVVYNAQKENNGNFIISKLTTYYVLVLTTGALFSIVGASMAIQFLFPVKYYYLIKYLPVFFLPMVCMECARLFQTAFGLSIKTWYIPVLSLIGLCLQAPLLFYLVKFNLWGVFIANTVAFSLYAGLSYVTSLKAYSYKLIDKEKIGKILISFSSFIGILHITFNNKLVFPLGIFFVLFLWPLVVWFIGIINSEEKEWLKNNIFSYIFFLKKNYLVKKEH